MEDFDDILKRNREFAACTQLTSLLITADIEYSSLTEKILLILHVMDKMYESSEIGGELKTLVHKSRLLHDLIERIKYQYNIIEDSSSEKAEEVRQLESELLQGLQTILEKEF